MNMDAMQTHRVQSLPTPNGTVDIPRKRKPQGGKVPCPVPGCSSLLGRSQERKRHVLTCHLPFWLHCPFPDCSWRGDRVGIFKSHWTRDHPSSSQELDEDQNKTYDPCPLVNGVVEGKLSIQDAEGQALSMVKKRAVELGMQELYEKPWGRKARRVQRLC
jgi:hypothetical protein